MFLTPEDFLRHAPSANALAIAGVGSSALGAAAFARNVADGLGEPVAAVVSGYGLADVLTEALGGFFGSVPSIASDMCSNPSMPSRRCFRAPKNWRVATCGHEPARTPKQ